MPIKDPAKLLETLCSQPSETEWLEFKQNHFNPDDVGRYVSALANSAMLAQQKHAFLIYGVQDGSHEIVGTTVRLRNEKAQSQVFEGWLATRLDPRLSLEFIDFDYRGLHISGIVIDPAFERPVRFDNEAYIRVGSTTQSLRKYPDRERSLWQATARYAFEQGVAAPHLTIRDIDDLFFGPELMERLKRPVSSQKGLVKALCDEGLLIDDLQGGYDATNLFAIVAAKDLRQFPDLSRKAPRVIQYVGTDRLESKSDETGRRGYALGFTSMLKYVKDRIKFKEKMRHGLRVQELMIPEISIREFLANALIHQDFTLQGSGPTLEIFEDRVVITNPGRPLVPTDRFIDAPARSRNEHLAGLLRRLDMCEERGSGIDRALDAIEREVLPPPLFQATDDATIVTAFGYKAFIYLTRDDRLRACYQHACLKFLANDPMRNGSLRGRFGLKENQYSQISELIGSAIEAELIRPLDASQGNRNARYVPHWA